MRRQNPETGEEEKSESGEATEKKEREKRKKGKKVSKHTLGVLRIKVEESFIIILQTPSSLSQRDVCEKEAKVGGNCKKGNNESSRAHCFGNDSHLHDHTEQHKFQFYGVQGIL